MNNTSFHSMLKIVTIDNSGKTCYIILSGSLTRRKAFVTNTKRGIKLQLNDCT